MDIRISVENVEPLTGTAAVEDGQELPFEGWMGLLDVISQLVNVKRPNKEVS